MVFRNLWLISREMRLLLRKKTSVFFMRSQPKSNLTPMAGGFGEAFTLKALLKYYELIPVAFSAVLAAATNICHCICHFPRCQDIAFSGHTMRNQKHRYIIDDEPILIEKYMVINQVYEWPPGLLKALKGDDNCEVEKRVKKVSFKFWKNEGNSKDDDDDE